MDVVPLTFWYPEMADQWTRRIQVPRSERRAWVHHHTAGGVGSDPLSYARQVARQHWEQWKVPGGYNFLIGLDGVIREMCGWDYQGVHSGTHEWNRWGLGLCFQGDYRTNPPTQRMLDAAAGLISEYVLQQTYHRAVRPTPTTCPGNALINLIPLEVDDMALTPNQELTVQQIHQAFVDKKVPQDNIDEIIEWLVDSYRNRGSGSGGVKPGDMFNADITVKG